MISDNIKRKIKYLQIRTKKCLNGDLIGDYNTITKGSGLEFDQIREYQQGDDIRFVDWKSSAKLGQLLVKQYFEQKNRNIIVVVDISESTFFSSSSNTKYDIMSQIAGILILASELYKDHINLLLFSNKVHLFIPYKSSRSHIYDLLKKVFEQKSQNNKTNINCALAYVNENVKTKSIIFFISDFIDENCYKKNLSITSRKHILVAIRCLEKFEQQLPEIGIINVNDFESNINITLKVSGYMKEQINTKLNQLITNQDNLFIKYGIHCLNINVSDDFFSRITYFFRKLII